TRPRRRDRRQRRCRFPWWGASPRLCALDHLSQVEARFIRASPSPPLQALSIVVAVAAAICNNAGGRLHDADQIFLRGPMPSPQSAARFGAPWHGPAILAVRKAGVVAIGGEGQVAIGQTVVKANAKRVRRLGKGDVIPGSAGATADAFTLFERLEAKL